MRRAAGGDASEFCDACFSGNYPTAIPDVRPQDREREPASTVAV
jgi:glutamine phosphoribosylpyrophosphate amidotransferase